MGIIPADAGAIAICFPCRPARAGVFVTKGDALVNVIADCLNAGPSGRRRTEQRPCDVGKPVGFAVAAAQQEHQGIVGEIRHRMLLRLDGDPVRHAIILYGRVGG